MRWGYIAEVWCLILLLVLAAASGAVIASVLLEILNELYEGLHRM